MLESEQKRNAGVLGGIASIAVGLGIDLLSNTLASHKVTDVEGPAWAWVVDPTRAQAFSHLGLAAMLFGFMLIAAVVHVRLQAPPGRDV